LPGIDERLRAELEALAHPVDDTGVFERIASKRARRRIVGRLEMASMIAVVLATMGLGAYGLSRVLALGDDARRPAGSPLLSSPSPSVSINPESCSALESSAVGDFDGDGTSDTATIGPSACFEQRAPIETPWALSVAYANGGGVWGMPECSKDTCRALGPAYLDGDGVNELAVMVESGASVRFVEFFRVPPGSDEPAPIAVMGPTLGAEEFQAGRPATFPYGGSVTHYAALGCDGTKVIFETVTLNAEQTEWAVRRFFLRLSDVPSPAHLLVTHRDDSTQAFTQEVGVGDIFEPGGPCWMESPQG
jgi:hypothetical protein